MGCSRLHSLAVTATILKPHVRPAQEFAYNGSGSLSWAEFFYGDDNGMAEVALHN